MKAQENSLLSERGSVTVDERTNSLLVLDTADKLEEIRDLIVNLDIQSVRYDQSRIVTASSAGLKSWAYSGVLPRSV